LKKVSTYFIVGILPIFLLSISPILWRSGFLNNPHSSPLTFVISLVMISLAWGISAYNINLGYEILNAIMRFFIFGRVKVRLLCIQIPDRVTGDGATRELFFMERQKNRLFGKKWVAIKNKELFPELRHSRSIAYFPDRKTAYKRLQSIKSGNWKTDPEFDKIIIETEFFI
jgi:hypothetical protein